MISLKEVVPENRTMLQCGAKHCEGEIFADWTTSIAVVEDSSHVHKKNHYTIPNI